MRLVLRLAPGMLSLYNENTPGFSGTWSNYRFFASGTIAASSGGGGLFLLRKREARPVF